MKVQKIIRQVNGLGIGISIGNTLLSLIIRGMSIYVFIYSLFKDAVSIPDYMASNGSMIGV
jgi:hypothetical protein